MTKKTGRAAAQTAILLLLTVSLMGCTNIEEPLDRLPFFKMLYVEDTGSTQLLVGGNDHLFSNISVDIDGEEDRENFTYYYLCMIDLDSFNLTVEVWGDEDCFVYEGRIEFSVEEKDVYYTEYTAENDEGKDHSSPWKKFLQEC